MVVRVNLHERPTGHEAVRDVASPYRPNFDRDEGAMTVEPRHRRLIGISEAAEYANVHPSTRRRRMADGQLPAYRVGPKLLKVDLDDVEALPRDQAPPPSSRRGGGVPGLACVRGRGGGGRVGRGVRGRAQDAWAVAGVAGRGHGLLAAEPGAVGVQLIEPARSQQPTDLGH